MYKTQSSKSNPFFLSILISFFLHAKILNYLGCSGDSNRVSPIRILVWLNLDNIIFIFRLRIYIFIFKKKVKIYEDEEYNWKL